MLWGFTCQVINNPVGETAVPSSDPNWNYNDPEHIWEREHFLICVKAGLKGAQQKVISYAWVSAITQEPSENPIAFLERLKEALQVLLERSCRGAGLQTTIRQVVSSCPTCHLNNSKELEDSSLSNSVGHTQERTGRWTSPRCQFLKSINTY